MRPLVLGFLILLPAAAHASDLSYGDTYAVPKSAPAPSDNSGSKHNDKDDDDDGSSGFHFHSGSSDDDGPNRSGGPVLTLKQPEHADLAGICFNYEIHATSGSEFVGAIIAAPIWWGVCSAAYGVVWSHMHLAYGNHFGDGTAPERDRWRYGAGFGLDYGWLARTASGVGSGLHLEAVGPLGDAGKGSLDVRLRAGAVFRSPTPEIDYARPVFSEGKLIGVERDVMGDYTQSTIPLSAELLWHPGRHGFYLAGGGGAAWMSETIVFERTTPAPTVEGTRTETREGVHPFGILALGRDGLAPNGRPRWYFEIRYQAIAHDPFHRSSFPADNVATTHSLGWAWGWYW